MMGRLAWILPLVAASLSAGLDPACAAEPLRYVEVGSITSPGHAAQLLYSSEQRKLVLRNSASAARVLDLETGSTKTYFSRAQFTDMSLSPDGRYAFLADYGGESSGSGTPLTPSHVLRLDLANGTAEVRTLGTAVAYHVEAVDDDEFILTSIDQWIEFSLHRWGAGPAAVPLSTNFFAFAYYGDVEYDPGSGRLLHGNSGLSSQEISAFKVTSSGFTAQEDSGTYGSASGHGGSSVLATDGSVFYYGKLQVEALDVKQNRKTFPEVIRAATAGAAFGNGAYYDAETAARLGSLGFSTGVYGMSRTSDDFWAYDPATERLRRFAPADAEIPDGAGAHPDLARTTAAVAVDVDVLANDQGFVSPVSVSVSEAPAHGVATVTVSPGGPDEIRIRYVPEEGYVGTDSLEYSVSDGTRTDSATLWIEVESAMAVNDTVIAPRSSGATIYVGRNDVGFSDPVTLTLMGPSALGAYVSAPSAPTSRNAAFFTYSPVFGSPSDDHFDTFTYQISDGVRSDVATVTVEVVTYRSQDDVARTAVDTAVSIDVLKNDIGFSWPTTTVGLFTAPRHGAVTPYDRGTLLYRPAPGFVGTETFVYAVDDGQRVRFATVSVDVIHDADLDGVTDEADNCVKTANADQRDSDLDGHGNACDADLNGDGQVNFLDLVLFRRRFGTADPHADFDGSGLVNFADLTRFKAMFMKAPGPSFRVF